MNLLSNYGLLQPLPTAHWSSSLPPCRVRLKLWATFLSINMGIASMHTALTHPPMLWTVTTAWPRKPRSATAIICRESVVIWAARMTTTMYLTPSWRYSGTSLSNTPAPKAGLVDPSSVTWAIFARSPTVRPSRAGTAALTTARTLSISRPTSGLHPSNKPKTRTRGRHQSATVLQRAGSFRVSAVPNLFTNYSMSEDSNQNISLTVDTFNAWRFCMRELSQTQS